MSRKLFTDFSMYAKIQIILREKCPYLEFFGAYYPAFGLNTRIYSVNFCIQSHYGKIRTRKGPDTDIFKQCSLQKWIYNFYISTDKHILFNIYEF